VVDDHSFGTDGPTGITLRSEIYLKQRLADEHAYAARHREPLSLLVLGIDGLAGVELAGGREARETAFEDIARFVRASVRAEDVVTTLSHERLAIILRGTHCAGGTVLAERFRFAIGQGRAGAIALTASIGVATHARSRPYDSPVALLDSAIACLERARKCGGDLVIADESTRSIPPLGKLAR
jgi:diguanylate cyclase (GGDEF)-like protein